jgi:hypothetical protein
VLVLLLHEGYAQFEFPVISHKLELDIGRLLRPFDLRKRKGLKVGTIAYSQLLTVELVAMNLDFMKQEVNHARCWLVDKFWDSL